MQTTQWRRKSSVVQRLIDEPYRFEFVQAVRVLVQLLRQHGVPYDVAFSHVLRFQNSLSLNFPASQIEDLAAPDARSATMLRLALERGELPRICLTPAFIGLLGGSGALPFHYTESVAAMQHREKDAGARAFLDTFSNRLVGQFYQAWGKYRLEHQIDTQGRDTLLPMMTALAGVDADVFERHGGRGGVRADVAGYYAALLRTRPIGAQTVARVLSDYFGVPVELEQFVGAWDPIPDALRSKLGSRHARLGCGYTLGVRKWSHERRVRVRVGPLDAAGVERFLPRSEGAAALEKMLGLFGVPGIDYEALILLDPSCIKPLTLSTRQPAAQRRLGFDAFLTARPGKVAHPEIRYMLHPF